MSISFKEILEIEASFNFITEGIRNLNNQNSAISSNHIPLQLLSSGFERLLTTVCCWL